MGRKGVSKRKPKKERPLSNSSGNSNTQQGGHSAVASLLKDSAVQPNRGGMNPSAGSNKNRNKGN